MYASVMPPTHPSQAAVAAAYRTLIAHETESKEQDFYRTRLQRLEQTTEPAETYECEFRCEEAIARAGAGVRCPACTAAMRDKEATEPAEEETKAEGPCEVRSPQGDTCWFRLAGHAGVHTWAWPDKKPASSPVAPAPNETGPWPTWQEVPDDTPFWSRDRRETNSWWWIRRTTERCRELRQADSCGETVHLGPTSFMNEFAPFVAAEEG
nr:MAG TPA: hypothetical protein [Caudoviricetes sp.]